MTSQIGSKAATRFWNLRWLCLTAFAVLLLAGCESAVLPPVAEPPGSQQLVNITLDFDLTENTVLSSVNPLSPRGQNGSSRTTGPLRPMLISGIINPYLTQDSAWCTGCYDGVQGWHQVFSALRNSSTQTLKIDSVVATCSGCVQITAASLPPAQLATGGSYTQGFNVNVNASRFSVSFSVWGEPL